MIKTFRLVDVEHGDSCPAASGQPDKPRANIPEVAFPALAAWIVKHNNAPRYEVSAAEIAGLGEIAFVTGPCEVPGILVPAMFSWNNVFNVEGK